MLYQSLKNNYYLAKEYNFTSDRTGIFVRRDAIRKTWGYEKRFSDVPIRTVFLIGQTDSRNIQDRLNDEHVKNGGDLVQVGSTFVLLVLSFLPYGMTKDQRSV